MAQDLSVNAVRRQAVLDLLTTVSALRTPGSTGLDAVVTHNEVNGRHGTGLLTQRLFRNSENVVSIRALNTYAAEQAFGRYQFVLPDGCVGRQDIYRWTLDMTDGLPISRVTCIPFGEPEVVAALALRDALGQPLCVYVMDDSNIHGGRISDELMDELLAKASIRLAISSDMRDAYEAKFGQRFWIVPPVLPAGIEPIRQRGTPGRRSAVIIGNIWGVSWLEALRSTLRATDLQVDWFASSGVGDWRSDVDGLAADHIRVLEPLSESALARRLPDYDVALVPSGPAGSAGENAGVASLSLPTRVASIVAATDVPIIVLGDQRSAVARFVTHFTLGVCSAYDAAELAHAVQHVQRPSWREQRDAGLPRLRSMLTMDDIDAWVRRATDDGRPPTQQFEQLSVPGGSFGRVYLEDTRRLGPWHHGFQCLHATMERLREAGLDPDFVIDVGASTGVWSYVVAKSFPRARYVLVEPLIERYDPASREHYLASIRHARVVPSALGTSPGTGILYIDPHLYGASLLSQSLDAPPAHVEAVAVPVTSIDELLTQPDTGGRGLLKLDIQGGELAALEGGRSGVERIDAIVIEVTLDPADEAIPSIRAVDSWLADAGFVYLDDAGEWRSSATGLLKQKDIVYVRRSSPLGRARRET